MTYRGYGSVISHDPIDGYFEVRARGLRRDLVASYDQAVPLAYAGFRRAVDGYLEWCQSRGVVPEEGK